jgi:hypothetical protein
MKLYIMSLAYGMGFELELYASHEIPMVFWYIILTPVTCITLPTRRFKTLSR